MWKASINKGAHVGQPALSVLFALLSLSIDAIVNKTEKALNKRLRGKPGFAQENLLFYIVRLPLQQTRRRSS